MNRFESSLSVLDFALETKRKRHIIGGILISAALLFGGLAYTVVTLRSESEGDDDEHGRYHD